MSGSVLYFSTAYRIRSETIDSSIFPSVSSNAISLNAEGMLYSFFPGFLSIIVAALLK